jgi:hypothetical protein
MHLNSKVSLLLLGLLIGGVVGYLTRPEAAEIKLAARRSSSPTTGSRPDRQPV